MDSFFQIIVGSDEVELTELLYHHYFGNSYILSLDVDKINDLLVNARKKANTDKLHNEWTSLLPWMYAGQLKLMSFADYCDARNGTNIDLRETDEIIAELEELHGRKLV